MILPTDSNAENSLYFLGAKVIKQLKTVRNSTPISFIDLYDQVRRETPLSLKLFQLTLDWLYLLKLVDLDSNGGIALVHK